MSFWRVIADRLNGQYQRKERVLAPLAKEAIAQALEEEAFGESGLTDYLELWYPFVERMIKPAQLSFYIGSFLARSLHGLTKDETSPPPRLRYEWLKICFAQDGECFDFGGARLPFATNESDERLFDILFREIMLPSLMGEGYPKIESFLCPDGKYELEGTVEMKRGDAVIDCGANAGFFSALASSKGCRVLAFEPTVRIREKYLNKTAELNRNIKVCPYALSDRKETQVFLISSSNLGTSRVFSPDMTPESVMEGDSEIVNALTLDEYADEYALDKVDFIKVDIEGAERKMLEGAAGVLKRFAPKLAVCIDHHPDDAAIVRELILQARPDYKIIENPRKLFAHI